jgi:hypothetical protein
MTFQNRPPSLYTQLGNADSPIVREAKTRRCEVCHAKPGENCNNNILGGIPLQGRIVHYARCEL